MKSNTPHASQIAADPEYVSLSILPTCFKCKAVGSENLVRAPATMSPVGQYSITTSPFLTRSRMKWYRMSMCLVFPVVIGLVARAMRPLLSSSILVEPDGVILKLVRS